MGFTYAGCYSANQIVNSAGVPQAGASVLIYEHTTTTLATLYTDRSKATTAANPATTDSAGNLSFYADPGLYDLAVAGFANRTTVEVGIDPSELGAFVQMLKPSGDTTGATDTAAVVAAAVTGAHVVLASGNWYFNNAAISNVNQVWLQGSGLGTVVNIISGKTGSTLTGVSKFFLTDMMFSGGSLGLNVQGAADSKFSNLYFTGQTSGGVYINGDDSSEQHWTDVVMSGVGGINFDYERTTNADMGGMYLDRVRIVNSMAGAVHAFKFNGTNASAPNINLLMTECVGDNWPGESLYIHGVNTGLIVNSWFTAASTATTGEGCIHLDNCALYTFTACHTVQASASGTAFGILISGGANDITIGDHFFAYNSNTALGVSGAGSNIVVGNYINQQPTFVDTPTNLTNITQYSGPRTFYTNGSGGPGNTIGLVDSSAPSVAKYLRNAGGSFQILNSAFTSALFSLNDAGKIVTPLLTTNSTIDDGSGNLEMGGYVQAGGGAGIRLYNNGQLLFQNAGGGSHWSGSGAPAAGLGSNGDYYFRTDTPGTANQRIYVKSAGAWAGIV